MLLGSHLIKANTKQFHWLSVQQRLLGKFSMISPSLEDHCLPAPPLNPTGLEVQQCPEQQITPWWHRQGPDKNSTKHTCVRTLQQAHAPASLVIPEFHPCQAFHLFQGLLVYPLRPEKEHMHQGTVCYLFTEKFMSNNFNFMASVKQPDVWSSLTQMTASDNILNMNTVKIKETKTILNIVLSVMVYP